jgi:hypothetical protein
MGYAENSADPSGAEMFYETTYIHPQNGQIDAEDKQNCQNDSFESPRGMTVINESGLYS